MSTQSRRKSLSVVEQLVARPQSFSFVQAVRILERAAVYSRITHELVEELPKASKDQPIARFSPPSNEALRFTNDHRLRFPACEIQKIEFNDKKNKLRWDIMVNFIGLTGAIGVMPFHYTEMILKRLKFKDDALAHFLNLFNHRTTSLFFQASTKYRLPLAYERHHLHEHKRNNESAHTQALLSLLGLGTEGLRNRQHLSDESLIYYSGLLTQKTRSASGLQQLIENYFNIPVRLESFVGQWMTLIDDVRTRLPWKGNKKGQNVCLGLSSMLGKRGWFAQGKSRITLGPLNHDQCQTFAPGTGALKALNELVSTYLGLEQDYDFRIEVKRCDIPNKIGLCKSNPPVLGWNTWLSGKPNTKTVKDDLLEIVVSSKKFTY